MKTFKKWPYFEDDDIKAVEDVLRSGKINRWTGSKNTEFEAKICESVGCKYAIALANGSLSLKAAISALNLQSGDEVITTCRTFIATGAEIFISGAKPVFADIDLNSQNISPKSILKNITSKTKAILVVHHAGFPCDMNSIKEIAKAHNLYVIEDCAQAHGAVYKGQPVGSIGDVAAWSYCQDKIITTGGEGGAVTTNSKDICNKIWSYKDHGKSHDAVLNEKHHNGFKWLVESFGTNLRMTEMQAALGICGYNKLPERIALRKRNATIYKNTFNNLDCIITPEVPEDIVHSYYKYCCRINLECLKAGWNRDRIVSEISTEVPCFSGTCWNVSAEKCFKDLGMEKSEKELPNAFVLKNTSIMFLLHNTISEEDMNMACEKISKVLKNAQR